MAPCDRRPLLLLWTVASAVLLHLSSAGPLICSGPCCHGTPSCVNATIVSCRCPGQRKIILRKGNLPRTMLKIVIFDTPQVIIGSDSFAGLESLSSIHLHNVDQLQLQENCLNLSSRTRLMSFTAENVSTFVHIKGSAFSGFWRHGTAVTFRSIELLSVGRNGFSFTSQFGGPKLIMEKIKSLDLDESACVAEIRQLHVSNVSMLKCCRNSFAGHISSIEMRHVEARQLNPFCISSSGALETLSFFSCQVGTVKPEGIFGSIQDVTIQETKITKLEENGFSMTVDSLLVTDCQIGELAPGGLNVTARAAIRLERITVDLLRERAFTRMRINDSENMEHPYFQIQGLTVKQAESESLKFWKKSEPKLYDLNVTTPVQFLCTPERWLRTLRGKGELELLTEADTQLMEGLNDSRNCFTADFNATELTTSLTSHHLPKEVTSAKQPQEAETNFPKQESGMHPLTTTDAVVPADHDKAAEAPDAMSTDATTLGVDLGIPVSTLLDTTTAGGHSEDGSGMTRLTLALTLGAVAVMAVAVLMAVLLLMPSARRRRQPPDSTMVAEMAARCLSGAEDQRPMPAAPARPGAVYEDISDRPALSPPRPPACPTPPTVPSRSILPFVGDRVPVIDYRPNRYPIL